jgi:hypothetical protein
VDQITAIHQKFINKISEISCYLIHLPFAVGLCNQPGDLDAIFNNLARRAIKAEYMGNLDRYLKLTLRAQSQSRATWRALATIKNPPVIGNSVSGNFGLKKALLAPCFLYSMC